jgi:predicted DNA-binding protein (MmcQ/YjbR family)
MISHKEIESVILSMPETILDYPFGEGVAVYKLGDEKGKMFAIVQEGSSPVQLSLKCDPGLAEVLREKYESVQPGYHLNKKHWNTIVCTGQVPDEELASLVRHSYELVKN